LQKYHAPYAAPYAAGILTAAASIFTARHTRRPPHRTALPPAAPACRR